MLIYHIVGAPQTVMCEDNNACIALPSLVGIMVGRGGRQSCEESEQRPGVLTFHSTPSPRVRGLRAPTLIGQDVQLEASPLSQQQLKVKTLHARRGPIPTASAKGLHPDVLPSSQPL